MEHASCRAAAPAIAVCLGLGGCTTVAVMDRSGGVTVQRHLLTVAVKVENSGQSHALASRGIGIFTSPMEVAIGAYRSEMAILGPDCRAVFWPTSAEHANAITRLVDLESICVEPKPSQREIRP